MMRRRRLLLVAVMVLAARGASALTIDWVTVEDPGNPTDGQVMSDGTSGYGSVPYVYRISKTEVTNVQYAEFLNAVAASDANALYSGNMGSPVSPFFGGITRSGSSGNFAYTAVAGRENMPVNWVSFYDGLRFANWLHNGQPTGRQDNTTTEDGAYTITPAGITANSITRNAGATIFLSSEDEWYKAAYYDAVSTSYFDYPAGTDTQIFCVTPRNTANRANCWPAVRDLTDVGAYPGSASPAGTFDQGGNVSEWNEAITSGSSRGGRGGSFPSLATNLAASARGSNNVGNEGSVFGFRVASLPEPGVGLLLSTGILGLALRGNRRRA